MNRRQKIIISVTGIFLVLLILVGLTYAYFLTQIQGNDEEKSITVTTAKLELVYGDNSEELIKGSGALVPSKTTEAEDAIGTKTFTVTNNGNDSSYVVIIDNVSVTKASDGSATTFKSNDFRFTLSCSVKDKSGNLLTAEKCNDVKSLSTFPIDGGILVGNAIPENKVHEYTLTMWYIDNGEDQSDDMNKHLQARVNIADVAQMENPFKTGVAATDTKSLAYNIIENSKIKKNGTLLVNTPPSKVGEEGSLSNWNLGEEENVYYNLKNDYRYEYSELEDGWERCNIGYYDPETDQDIYDCSSIKEYTSCTQDVIGKYLFEIYDSSIPTSIYVNNCDNGKIVTGTAKYEKVLSSTTDDYGTSYYFRGDVEDNYVNFAGMCWRIVRIAGDGSTKLILEDQYTTCDDDIDTDNEGTADYKYTGNWSIGYGNYGYELKNVDTDSDLERIMNYLNPVTDKERSMVKSFYDFQTTKLEDYTGKLKAGDWCLGDKAYTQSGGTGSYTYTPLEKYDYSRDFYYDSTSRLDVGNLNKQPTLTCNGTVLDKFATVSGVSSKVPMYVSAITADEIIFAGANNPNYYLVNDYSEDYHFYWSLSPQSYSNDDDYVFAALEMGGVDGGNFVHTEYEIRPAINLAPNSSISDGEGTIDNPYVIE